MAATVFGAGLGHYVYNEDMDPLCVTLSVFCERDSDLTDLANPQRYPRWFGQGRRLPLMARRASTKVCPFLSGSPSRASASFMTLVLNGKGRLRSLVPS